jgi:hypothetical protein
MRRSIELVLAGFALTLLGCAEPAQLGGLGVLNPSGFAGRMALAGRVNGSAAPKEPTPFQRELGASNASVVHSGSSAR